jgi:hypothetical protein
MAPIPVPTVAVSAQVSAPPVISGAESVLGQLARYLALWPWWVIGVALVLLGTWRMVE